jgi:peroxiredoxin
MPDILVISHVALWVLVTMQGLVLLGLLQAVFKRQGAGTPAVSSGDYEGHPAPAFAAEEISGEIVTSRDLDDMTRAFVFVSPDCPRCSLTLKELEGLSCKADGNLILVCQSSPEKCRRLAELYELDHRILIDSELSLSKSFGVMQVPAAVLVDANNRIIKHGRRVDEAELESLLLGNATARA